MFMVMADNIENISYLIERSEEISMKTQKDVVEKLGEKCEERTRRESLFLEIIIVP